VERALNLFVVLSLVSFQRLILSDEDDQPISQLFSKTSKKSSNLKEDDQPNSQLFSKTSKKSSNLNKDDQPISQLLLKTSKKSRNLKEDDQGKLSKKSPKKQNRNMAFARTKNPKQNVLEGLMLELTDDRKTRQVFVEKKMVPADFVGNNLVLQIDQDIACPCCLKKTSLVGFYSHSRMCYLYCYKFDKIEQFKRFTGAKKNT
jgi:hypothetical protein